MCRRPDDRAAHGRHAAAVRIGRDDRECHVGQHPAKQGKAPRPVFAEPPAQKRTVRLPAQTFSRETAKTSARKQSQLLCKNVPVQKRWTRRPAKRRPALRGTHKSIRKRPDCAISRHAIRACPGVTFRRLRRFADRGKAPPGGTDGHCSPAYACPLFFTTRETTLRPRPATTVTDAATSAAPTERRASAPRRRNKRGAFPCGAAAAAHPRAPAHRAFPTPARPHGRFLPSVYGEG